MFLGSRARRMRKAHNVAAICEPIVYTMWDSQYLTTEWASRACYGDSFTLLLLSYRMTSQGPPMWSSGQSSRLQIQTSGFDSQRYQIFWEVVGLKRGPLSPMSTTEELMESYV
jgi:hypothetical protein